MFVFGQVQCGDWASFNVDIGPGPKWTLNWPTFDNLAPRDVKVSHTCGQAAVYEGNMDQ